MTGSRILVQGGCADEVRSRLADSEAFGSATVWTRTPTWAPHRQAERRQGQRHRRGSARLRQADRTGWPPTEAALAAGAFYRPTLLEVDDVTSDIVQKEVFGPVATFEVFDTEADAIARANAGEMGLAAGVFTNNLNISNRVSRGIKAGTVWTNTWAASMTDSPRAVTSRVASGAFAGRSRITEFQEAKTVVHSVPPPRQLTGHRSPILRKHRPLGARTRKGP